MMMMTLARRGPSLSLISTYVHRRLVMLTSFIDETCFLLKKLQTNEIFYLTF